MDIEALCPHHRAQFDGAMATLTDVFPGRTITIIVGSSEREIGGHVARELGIVTIPADAGAYAYEFPPAKDADADAAPRSTPDEPSKGANLFDVPPMNYTHSAGVATLESFVPPYLEAIQAGIEAGYTFSFSMYPKDTTGGGATDKA